MHRSRAPLAFLITVLIFASVVAPAFGATAADLQKHRSAAEDARKKAAAADSTAKKLAGEVEDLDKEIDRIESQAKALEPKITTAAERTALIRKDVRRLTNEVETTRLQIEETQAEYDRQQGLLKNRVAATYRQGNWFYLSMVLGSANVGDLIQRTEFVTRVIESNGDVAAQLASTENTLSRAKEKLDRSLEAVKVKEQEAAQVESGLRNLRAQRTRAANQREAVQSKKQGLVAENRANAKRLRALAQQEEAESAKIAGELSGSGSGQYAGTMSWPVPASHRITSNFGWRVHPIFRTRRLHTGLDIGAGSGSAIVAAGSGRVVSAGYRGGYGNTVIIDHGNGVMTLYAHQLSGGMKVRGGQNVTRGQRIGTVGSTGNSTGPHLHFEVRVNGVPKNPRNYL